MQKNGIDIFKYYENIWNTGNIISQSNIRIEYVIKYFCANELNTIINSLNDQNKQKVYSFFQNVQELQKKLSEKEKNVNLMTYSNYVQQFYINIYNEELYENITYQTIQKFNICADLIEVFKLYNALDSKLLKIQQYCRYKAFYLEDCLNNNKNIKRGGFEEFIYNPDKSYNINSNIINQNKTKEQNLQYNNKFNNQNYINNSYNKYTEYNNNKQNISNNNNKNINESNNDENLGNNNFNDINKHNNCENTENYLNENYGNTIVDYPDIPNDPYSLSQIYNNNSNNLNDENNILSENKNENLISKSNPVIIENENKLKYQSELNSKINDENNIKINNNLIKNNNNQNNVNNSNNILNNKNNMNYLNSGMPVRKLYKNNTSPKFNIKESILSFDENILFNKSKYIILNNKNVIMSLKSKQINNTIQLLQNSIKMLKKFPKQNELGFYN